VVRAPEPNSITVFAGDHAVAINLISCSTNPARRGGRSASTGWQGTMSREAGTGSDWSVNAPEHTRPLRAAGSPSRRWNGLAPAAQPAGRGFLGLLLAALGAQKTRLTSESIKKILEVCAISGLRRRQRLDHAVQLLVVTTSYFAVSGSSSLLHFTGRTPRLCPPQVCRKSRKRAEVRFQTSRSHAAILAGATSRTTPATGLAVIGIARGFIASGTTRTRSTRRSPFSKFAPFT
jgi:hypothetical protein